jgi:hypothetical protein
MERLSHRAQDKPACSIPDAVAHAKRRLLAFVSDGGSNVRVAGRLLIGDAAGDDTIRARICASHTLQLFLKYFWYVLAYGVLLTCDSLHAQSLSTALGCIQFFARYVHSSTFAYERIGALAAAVSTRWNSELVAVDEALKKKQIIEAFASHPKATDAFVARWVSSRCNCVTCAHVVYR